MKKSDFNYETISSNEISALFEEILDKFPEIDADLINGILYLSTDAGDFVINQHFPTKQIWLSSPVSNVGYFNYYPDKSSWLDKNKISLRERISQDLSSI